uniref:NADH-ubiquinone oxidoreductase chain 2 n=1 Tax=Stegobium paniceum TaxID=295656 RepID=A0A343C0Y2_STEPN|nr:NADH dehydrogenase subunit 2 [Stegobium paniceum]ARH10883.1 NADH dehydrogenase subunit 2 [Stegobium paniceum]
MKLSNLLFMISVMVGTLISISSNSWVSMWVGLEINLLSIIPLMDNKIKSSSESSIKYFVTQALASTIFLFSIIIMSKNLYNFYNLNSNLMIIMNMSLLTKMGAAPFHFWFPEIMEGLNWMTSLIMLTWQKIAPMMILMSNISTMKFLFIIIILSLIIGGVMGLNQTSLRKILAYSSINHIGWMIAAFCMNFSIWLIYFLVYSLISCMLIISFSKLMVFNLNQLFSQLKLNEMVKFSININFFSMGGLPPFIGFFPKWLTINSLIMNDLMILSMIMVILTLMTLFYYTRIMIFSFLMNSDYLNFYFIKKSKNFLFFTFNLINLMSLLILILVYIFF